MKSKKLKKINWLKLRKIHYIQQRIKCRQITGGDDIENWRKNPYTFLKAKFNIETSALMVYFFQLTRITPNNLTFMYILLGFLGGLFLASNNNILILTSLIFFFTKGAFDWGDGFLAQIKDQKSNLGSLLDNWGAKVGSYSFIVGLGYYLYNKQNEEIFLALSLFIIFLKSIDLREYAYQLAMFDFMKDKNKKFFFNKLNLKKNVIFSKKKFNFLRIFKSFIQNFIDDRARSVDLILLLILIDNFFYNIFLLKYIFYYIALKTLIIFCGGTYVTTYKNYLFKK